MYYFKNNEHVINYLTIQQIKGILNIFSVLLLQQWYNGIICTYLCQSTFSTIFLPFCILWGFLDQSGTSLIHILSRFLIFKPLLCVFKFERLFVSLYLCIFTYIKYFTYIKILFKWYKIWNIYVEENMLNIIKDYIFYI